MRQVVGKTIVGQHEVVVVLLELVGEVILDSLLLSWVQLGSELLHVADFLLKLSRLIDFHELQEGVDD